ncbi:hypothetical protein M011DRAFT_512966 [Sporormia fimetaria CBS 119925]|uniref:Uncharacterized protein n=1 Tax=Sporormia fimetaria CBS 119925 TaxID=1340428 RepID=A0A6A6UWY4_9PLEO|nr:hypothetical protein M011DRAFT_512966 [Sporormia fimetaria CBS 119925]
MPLILQWESLSGWVTYSTSSSTTLKVSTLPSSPVALLPSRLRDGKPASFFLPFRLPFLTPVDPSVLGGGASRTPREMASARSDVSQRCRPVPARLPTLEDGRRCVHSYAVAKFKAIALYTDSTKPATLYTSHCKPYIAMYWTLFPDYWHRLPRIQRRLSTMSTSAYQATNPQGWGSHWMEVQDGEIFNERLAYANKELARENEEYALLAQAHEKGPVVVVKSSPLLVAALQLLVRRLSMITDDLVVTPVDVHDESEYSDERLPEPRDPKRLNAQPVPDQRVVSPGCNHVHHEEVHDSGRG